MKKLAMAIVMVLICVGVWAADPDKIKYEWDGLNGGYIIIGYDGIAEGRLEIPATYRNRPVLLIDNNAFSGHRLTSLVIESGIEAIGMEAFQNNRLTEVIFPDSAIYIDDSAFRNNQLTEVIIYETTEMISSSEGQPAFDANVRIIRR